MLDIQIATAFFKQMRRPGAMATLAWWLKAWRHIVHAKYMVTHALRRQRGSTAQ
jgi:hypothetical protein